MNRVIRVSSGATLSSRTFSGRSSGRGVKEGAHRVLGRGRRTARHPVQRQVIVTRERGREEALVPGTDLDRNRRKIAAVFERRTSVEEPFRDEKNVGYGWGLRSTEVGSRGRPARLLLVLAFAYLSPVTMGLLRRDTMSEAHWTSASTRSNDRACGFTIGRFTPTRAKRRPSAVLEAPERMLTGWVEENWG